MNGYNCCVPSYDFRSLSPYEFECLVRDLLQAELKVRLEAFAAGRDKGIDLRFSQAQGQALIVQCKHFVRSGLSSLRAHLKKEVVKVRQLAPSRYVVATSVALTPDNKKDIARTFAPFLLDEADILGQDDLNNLLGRHSEIEKSNFKLWLTSAAVLDKLLHSRIYNQTASLVEDLENKVRLYVPNQAFPRAKKVLNDQHVCIIAGIPGIGKTMLAEMLLVAHIDQGFEPTVISSDVGEGDEAFKPDQKQIFYYDDFLGQASHADKKLNKNEDARLLSFLRRVRSSKNKRFVLTTREYILTDARMRYEKLADVGTRVDTCVIALADYSELAKARILYNHLYFSMMNRDTRNAVLEDRSYLRVIRHPNYNPRLIGNIVDLGHRDQLDPRRFMAFLMKTLDEPATLWRNAFENQISDAARTLLIGVVSLSFEVDLDDLKDAFDSLFEAFAGRAARLNEFQNTLKVLEDTFIRVERFGSMRVVSFHNPSIRDFMLSELNQNADCVTAILIHGCFFDQASALWRYAHEPQDHGSKQLKYPGIAAAVASKHHLCFEGLVRTLESRCTTLMTHNYSNRCTKEKESASRESRLSTLAEVAASLSNGGASASCVAEHFDKLADSWSRGAGNKQDAIELFDTHVLPPQCREVARKWFLDTLNQTDDFQLLLDLQERVPDLFTEEDLERVRDEFPGAADADVDWVLWEADDAGSAEEAIDKVTSIGRALSMEIYYDKDQVRARIDRLSERGGDDGDDYDRARDERLERLVDEAEIDSLFGALTDDDA
jgi:hypothetical protein